MARGGKREGSGRKPGSVSKRTKEVMAKAEELGCDPVEALLELTAWAMKQWRDTDSEANRIPFGEAAADWASKAAPYVRPKLSQVEVNADLNSTVRDITDEPVSAVEWEDKHVTAH